MKTDFGSQFVQMMNLSLSFLPCLFLLQLDTIFHVAPSYSNYTPQLCSKFCCIGIVGFFNSSLLNLSDFSFSGGAAGYKYFPAH